MLCFGPAPARALLATSPKPPIEEPAHGSTAPDGVVRPAGKRGPKTAAGKARAARNALEHGLRAHLLVLLDDEDASDLAGFEAAVRAELNPAGALEGDLVARVVAAAWRARRADRLEAALLNRCLPEPHVADLRARQTELGYGLMRHGNGPRALETLVRYRGSVLAELFARCPRSRRAAPALLPLTAPKTKRIREHAPKQ